MTYDTSSTHPVTQALIRTASDVPPNDDADAGGLAAQLETVFRTASTDLSGVNLANTLVVEVIAGGVLTKFAFDVSETNSETGVILEDSAGRKFVAVELTMTQAEYDALSYKPPNTIFNITA